MSAVYDLAESAWVKSSYSTSEGGNCVEWAPAHASEDGAVPVRDSKCPGGPILTFSQSAWSGLIGHLRPSDG